MKPVRDYMQAVLLDWTNNYLTVEKFAEHNGINEQQALAFLKLAREIDATPHPEG